VALHSPPPPPPPPDTNILDLRGLPERKESGSVAGGKIDIRGGGGGGAMPHGVARLNIKGGESPASTPSSTGGRYSHHRRNACVEGLPV
jgi:hypothetical protein